VIISSLVGIREFCSRIKCGHEFSGPIFLICRYRRLARRIIGQILFASPASASLNISPRAMFSGSVFSSLRSGSVTVPVSYLAYPNLHQAIIDTERLLVRHHRGACLGHGVFTSRRAAMLRLLREAAEQNSRKRKFEWRTPCNEQYRRWHRRA
jgi:hypothetical protein